MSIFSKHIDKRIAAYQRELIETHYQEVETMYKQIRGWRHDYRNHITISDSRSRAAVYFCLLTLGTRERVGELLDANLIHCIIFF